MRTAGRVIGWLLILGSIIGIGVVVWLFTSGRFPGGFLPTLLVSAPAILALLIGIALTRAGRKQTTTFGEPDPQWTRRSLR